MQATAVDLFSGAGGATEGLRQAGFSVLGAVELEGDPARSYAANHPDTRLWNQDVRTVTATTMQRELGLGVGELTLLKACPPCQGFSSLARFADAVDDARNDLVGDLVRFVRAFRPAAVLVENVPGLAKDRRFGTLKASLHRLGYAYASYLLNAVDLGVPQRRRRLVLVAFRGRRRAGLPVDAASFLFDGPPPPLVTVGEALEVVTDGRAADPLRRFRRSNETVRRRLQSLPLNGTRFELPSDLQLKCHRILDEAKVKVATSSYGRMRADQPAPTMTTRCTTPACGSFVHPTEARGISLREAATLQTFPRTYQFVGGYDSIERQIGNAVPVEMARMLGLAVLRSLESDGRRLAVNGR